MADDIGGHTGIITDHGEVPIGAQQETNQRAPAGPGPYDVPLDNGDTSGVPLSNAGAEGVPLDNGPVTNPPPAVPPRKPMAPARYDDTTDKLDTGPGYLGTAQEDYATPPTKLDNMTEARMNGYDWPEIDAHLAAFHNIAAQWGHSDDDVAAHLGDPDAASRMPGVPVLDPNVPTYGVARPLMPGEYTNNPDGGWSNEVTTTAMLNGKPSVIPTMWLLNGVPHQVDEDRAVQLAEQSGLKFQSYPTMEEADQASIRRENAWQDVDRGDRSVPPLWTGVPGTPYHDNKAFIDYGIGIAQTAGLGFEAAKNARDNLAQFNKDTGAPPDQAYRAAQQDPLFQDQMTSDLAPSQRVQEILGLPRQPEPIVPTTPTLEELERGDKDAINKVYFLPGEELPDESSFSQALKDAGVDALMYTGGELAGRYIIAPLARQVMEMAAPPLAKMGEAVKGVLGNESGQLGEGEVPRPGIGHNMPPEAIDDINTSANAIGNARLVRPPELPVPAGINYTATRGGFSVLEDELNRLRTNDTADKIHLLKIIDALPAEWRKDSFQEQVAASVEQRLASADHVHEPEVQQFLDSITGLTDKQFSLARSIDTRLNGKAADYDPSLRISSVEEGYMHRIRQDAEVPEGGPGQQQDVITTGSQQHTLSKWASGMRAREGHFVFDNGNGTRTWGGTDPEDHGYKMGQTVESPDENQWTVRPATMSEIEGNTPIRYNKNFLINTVENVARLSRVDRNLKFLDTAGKTLEEQGQFVRETPGKYQTAPAGMLPINIPQMTGWAIPKVAHPLNDFFEEYPQGDFLNAIRAGNRMLLNTMFLNPLPHAGNMGFQWFYARGSDWLPGSGGYGRLMRTMMQATEEVNNMGPKYREHLREGAALQYGQTQTSNFWQIAQDKMIHDMVAAPEIMEPYAKQFGVKVSDLYAGMLDWSKAHMWNWGDRLALARQFELVEKGMSIREAIFQSEKDINNYRTPSLVLGSHILHQAIVDPAFSSFNRYRFGLIRSMALMANDIMRGTGGERIEALSKATLIAGMTLVVWPGINYGLSKLPGHMKLGEFGLGSLLYNVARLRNLPTDQGAWISALGSLIELSPLLQLVTQVTTNRDVFGHEIINWRKGPGHIAGDAVKEVLKQTMPGEMILDAMKASSPAAAIGGLLGSLVKLRAQHPPSIPSGRRPSRGGGSGREGTGGGRQGTGQGGGRAP